MVEGAVQENANVIEGCAFDANGLMKRADLFKLFGDYPDIMLCQQRRMQPVI